MQKESKLLQGRYRQYSIVQDQVKSCLCVIVSCQHRQWRGGRSSKKTPRSTHPLQLALRFPTILGRLTLLSPPGSVHALFHTPCLLHPRHPLPSSLSQQLCSPSRIKSARRRHYAATITIPVGVDIRDAGCPCSPHGQDAGDEPNGVVGLLPSSGVA